MFKKLIGPLIFGIGGCAVLVSLGLWQVERLQWKQEMLAGIESRIAAMPGPLPTVAVPGTDQYLPVEVTGRFGETGLRVLASRKHSGAGHRLIQRFETGERSILVDRGFLPQPDEAPELPAGEVTIRGNLLWPDETDGFTPSPDLAGGLWFARDVPEMASALGTEPVLVVIRDPGFDDGAVDPMPVSSEGIPNDHREYAITWFSLAAIWLAMTGYLFYRTLRPQGDDTT
ncbi:Surf1 protein [Pseudooceanicola batsensis HTCC2597]|uniref:SURF1-like protein n=1 Tax=Pseudooceanicola batsensis (strain ATCC BAA-863 / DSM 15984 / KCTC 12145 / HTCC2597) TaxID=252305 RepID=A3TZ56_PSEBH|nr:SURF1 family protein [Pseudooceanicola batsensis]EAQ02874.1 Surf1 protein [Pseudooceanicola batsensis HTCC2597]